MPLVLELTLTAKRDPVPYLLGLAASANIGSVATATGNPQNIMIASFSHIGYARFAGVLTPIALVGLIVAFALVVLFYRREFLGAARIELAQRLDAHHLPLVLGTTAVMMLMIVGFFTVSPIARPAILAGAVLLLAPGSKAYDIYREIDWPLLMLFSGLFIVVAGAEKILLTPDLLNWMNGLNLARIPVLSVVAAALSNVISNVPAVLVLRPFIAHLPRPETSWLTLAMASTLAGNFTILGSVANLIVVQKAAQQGIRIGFATHLRLGLPLTLISLAAGIAMMMALHG